ncbi:MAG: glycosyltransferase family 4 protein [Alphaproteobacteria bacterium]|nr:glycosyltransferase family 4 protein [Alphaproteobacteria bacterium]
MQGPNAQVQAVSAQTPPGNVRAGGAAPLRIVHVLRAPLGGLFRHVLDLSREQVARGHAVGIIADSLTGGDRAAQVLGELEPELKLGLLRLPVQRNPHFSDIRNLRAIAAHLAAIAPEVIHGHGSKGGLYARLPGLLRASPSAIRAYTPHGGSFNYNPGSMLHRIDMRAEATLERATDLYLFESDFIGQQFNRYVGATRAQTRVVVNGISDAEFEQIETSGDAAEFVYVGELRSAKGIDTMLDAIALVSRRSAFHPSASLVGSGPDGEALAIQARKLGLADRVHFLGAMPAREAFRRGRILIVPSRAESLPYVVLEAAGAAVPMIATNVGGIPEIFGPHAGRLIVPNNADILAAAMIRMLTVDGEMRQREALQVRDYVRSRFHISMMVDEVIAGYHAALAKKRAAQRA